MSPAPLVKSRNRFLQHRRPVVVFRFDAPLRDEVPDDQLKRDAARRHMKAISLPATRKDAVEVNMREGYG